MNAAQTIRTARIIHGLTQVQLAQRAGTSQPVISAYENGLRDPSLETLRRLVEAAGSRLSVTLLPEAPGQSVPATPQESGERLVDVLLLADALPQRVAGSLNFPRIQSTTPAAPSSE